ncbi:MULTISPECIES: hypothetical protein [unclassified Endozoicomonas]|uniref:hypothetical protein n=1 Tax=unclassified Endozoicomonas TaxID=2644528 RepID=UPI003BB497D6
MSDAIQYLWLYQSGVGFASLEYGLLKELVVQGRPFFTLHDGFARVLSSHTAEAGLPGFGSLSNLSGEPNHSYIAPYLCLPGGKLGLQPDRPIAFRRARMSFSHDIIFHTTTCINKTLHQSRIILTDFYC